MGEGGNRGEAFQGSRPGNALGVGFHRLPQSRDDGGSNESRLVGGARDNGPRGVNDCQNRAGRQMLLVDQGVDRIRQQPQEQIVGNLSVVKHRHVDAEADAAGGMAGPHIRHERGAGREHVPAHETDVADGLGQFRVWRQTIHAKALHTGTRQAQNRVRRLAFQERVRLPIKRVEIPSL